MDVSREQDQLEMRILDVRRALKEGLLEQAESEKQVAQLEATLAALLETSWLTNSSLLFV